MATEPDGAHELLRTLTEEGVDVVFGYPGGASLPIYDALTHTGIRHVLVRHEQAASHAADGYARVTGKVGVCLSTSGPGATNMITGLLNAAMDGVPILAITGQVPTSAIGTDAFQEADTLSISLPVTKASLQVRTVAELSQTIHLAFKIARSGRPGPVLVDLPKDVAQGTKSDHHRLVRPPRTRPRAHGGPLDPKVVRDVVEALTQAQRPLVLVGRGATGSAPAVERFLERLGLPSISSLLGLGVVPHGFPGFLGMVGMHGTVEANRAITASDFILSLGARFDDRLTGNPKKFVPGAKVAHVDIEPSQLGKTIPTHYPVAADVGVFLDMVEELIPDDWRATGTPWGGTPWAHGGAFPEPDPAKPDTPGELSAITVFSALRSVLHRPYRIVTDVGQHQMWAALYLPILRPYDFLSSGGLGTMGFGLPAALGAQVGAPTDEIWLVTGDGSFVMSEQEMGTAVAEHLPVRIVLLDNRGLGMIRQWQELFYDRRFSQISLGDVPHFGRLAEAYGVEAFTPRTAQELRRDFAAARDVKGPALIHVPLRQEENVFPMIPPGGSHADVIVSAEEAAART